MSRSLQKIEGADGQASRLSVLAAQIEALLFLASSPVPEGEMRTVLGVSAGEVSSALSELSDHLGNSHGLVVRSVAGGWVLETNPHFAEVLALFRDSARKGRVRLSRAAVETLAVIAYNQPVTRAEVEELRGVRSERVIETLLSHGLIRIAGRKKASGSPLLYRTTPRFLEIFGLEAIADLPSLEELGELGADPLDDLTGSGEESSSEPAEYGEMTDAP
ncbi:MAG: SMC-Scp complex subunit ScpB [Fretibacterium sp.]|nr:SMC-Scp complex subunit ScpB [Fretibacterium sp. OH1220_COT-178]MDO4787162.1 SMC-Scp complex subunit ScpB [Fretibacterium sp.]RRD65648.1 SMC-Scp complex subunit ScpB [Fretibacterium sp. OH1220_COT-178]